MGRVINGFVSIIIALMVISGCASDEEKKTAYFEKGNIKVRESNIKNAV